MRFHIVPLGTIILQGKFMCLQKCLDFNHVHMSDIALYNIMIEFPLPSSEDKYVLTEIRNRPHILPLLENIRIVSQVRFPLPQPEGAFL